MNGSVGARACSLSYKNEFEFSSGFSLNDGFISVRVLLILELVLVLVDVDVDENAAHAL